MSKPRLQHAEQSAEAEWLRPRLHPFGSGWNAIIPDGFPAYVRILHPARGRGDRPVRWAEVAARSGRTMGPLADFDSITRVPLSIGNFDPVLGISPPECGNLAPDLLAALCSVLAEHTRTPELCWFCLWEGYGWLNDGGAGWTFYPKDHVPDEPIQSPNPPHAPERIVSEWLRAARVHLPWRDYLLLRGPLDAARELGWTLSPGHFIGQSPNLFWPQDHAWCVASEIDFFCTLVAGSEGLADAITSDSRLEAWRFSPSDSLPGPGD